MRFQNLFDKFKDTSSPESLQLKINLLIQKHFKKGSFGYLLVSKKKIKLYLDDFNEIRCICSILHNADQFQLAAHLRNVGFSEALEETIPEVFQKEYYESKIFVFPVST